MKAHERDIMAPKPQILRVSNKHIDTLQGIIRYCKSDLDD